AALAATAVLTATTVFAATTVLTAGAPVTATAAATWAAIAIAATVLAAAGAAACRWAAALLVTHRNCPWIDYGRRNVRRPWLAHSTTRLAASRGKHYLKISLRAILSR